MSDDPTGPPGMPSIEESDGKPGWDQDDADWLIGQYVLVGITRRAHDGTVKSQRQFHGRVTKAEKDVGIRLRAKAPRPERR